MHDKSVGQAIGFCRLPSMKEARLSRREALLSVGALASPFLFAQEPQLPLHTGGIEYIGMTVPDQEAPAKFYGRIFDPQLFQERDPPPRFYVKIGINYIAFGGPRDAMQKVNASIDHFCAVVRRRPDEVGIGTSGRRTHAQDRPHLHQGRRFRSPHDNGQTQEAGWRDRAVERRRSAAIQGSGRNPSGTEARVTHALMRAESALCRPGVERVSTRHA
jgi:hypothetical protein